MRHQYVMPPGRETLAPQPDRVARETVHRVTAAAMIYMGGQNRDLEAKPEEFKVASYGTPGKRGHRFFTTEQSHRRYKVFRNVQLLLRFLGFIASVIAFTLLDHVAIIYALGTWLDGN